MVLPMQALASVELNYNAYEWSKLGMMPWFNFKVNSPERPLPPISDRPHLKTKRLLIRPIFTSDLEAFYDLRRRIETQVHSTTRGRPDRDLAETREYIQWLQDEDQAHWYFGAFLVSTGELIGEGGLPDCLAMPRSGWPEPEFLIKPEHWRQGYGTEMWEAVLDSWWDLPRELRRHQLNPALLPNKEPGDVVIDGVAPVWESSNVAAKNFVGKMLGPAQMTVGGTLEAIDMRPGREGNIVSWAGGLMENPRAYKA